MTDHRMLAESGHYQISGTPLGAKVARGGRESWQFFAFIFAALVTLAFAAVDNSWARAGLAWALRPSPF